MLPPSWHGQRIRGKTVSGIINNYLGPHIADSLAIYQHQLDPIRIDFQATSHSSYLHSKEIVRFRNLIIQFNTKLFCQQVRFIKPVCQCWHKKPIVTPNLRPLQNPATSFSCIHTLHCQESFLREENICIFFQSTSRLARTNSSLIYFWLEDWKAICFHKCCWEPLLPVT